MEIPRWASKEHDIIVPAYRTVLDIFNCSKCDILEDESLR